MTKQTLTLAESFRSLDHNKEKETGKAKRDEDKEFEEQRRATIMAAVETKAEVSGKFLGANSKVTTETWFSKYCSIFSC